MKYAGLKLAAYVGQGVATLAVKKKDGLVFTSSNTQFYGKSGGFCCDVGGTYTYVQFKKVGKKFLVTVNLPRKGDRLEFYSRSKKKFEQFLQSEYLINN